MPKAAFGLSVALGLGLLSGLAQASPVYPAEVRAHLGLELTPNCTLCHVGQPGTGTANSSFAQSARARGLHGGADLGALDRALDALAAEKVDSDGDGMSDIEELQAGRDPNVAGEAGVLAGSGSVEEPAYGCVGQVAPAPASFGPAIVGSALFGALFLSRRRRH